MTKKGGYPQEKEVSSIVYPPSLKEGGFDGETSCLRTKTPESEISIDVKQKKTQSTKKEGKDIEQGDPSCLLELPPKENNRSNHSSSSSFTATTMKSYSRSPSGSEDVDLFISSLHETVENFPTEPPVNRTMIIPGAFAEGGGVGIPYYHNDNVQGVRRSQTLSRMIPCITEAMPVMEEEVDNAILQQAQPVSSSGNRGNGSSSGGGKDCQNWKVSVAIILATFLLIGSLVVAGGMSFSSSSSSGGDQKQDSPTPHPTINMDGETTAPTQLTDVMMAHDASKSNLLIDRLGLPRYTVDAIHHHSSGGSSSRTPQYLAYEWLQKDPNLDKYSPSKARQRLVMATIYYSLRGEQWTQKDGWLDDVIDECNWTQSIDPFGRVSGTRQLPIDVCDDQGRITDLVLGNSNLQGSIPREISMLSSSLEVLDLSFNLQIKGVVPTQLGLLTNLKELVLDFTSVTSTVPSELCQLQKLEWLGLVNNSLSGTIPSCIKELSTNLRSLKMGETNLTLPKEVYQLSKLETLYLGNNQGLHLPLIFEKFRSLKSFFSFGLPFPGSIPTEIGLATNLTYFGLGKSKISGPLPSELGLLSNLQYLDLGSNSLSGSLPTALTRLSDLRVLQIDCNRFTGTIPSTLFQHFVSMNHLSIADNLFTGTLPSQVALLTSLQKLMVEKTSLSGTIPKELSSIASLSQLVFVNTDLKGSIPDAVCDVVVRDEADCERLDLDCLWKWTNNSICQGTALCGCSCDEC